MRIRFINQLRKKKNAKVVPQLVKFLKEDNNSIVRHEAAYSLGELGHEIAISCLIDSLKHDPDEIVRHEAAFALGIMARPAALKAIKEVGADRSKIVRDTVKIAIDNLQYDLKSTRRSHRFPIKVDGKDPFRPFPPAG
jgi:deoxyhypusine monooxygenase